MGGKTATNTPKIPSPAPNDGQNVMDDEPQKETAKFVGSKSRGNNAHCRFDRALAQRGAH